MLLVLNNTSTLKDLFGKKPVETITTEATTTAAIEPSKEETEVTTTVTETTTEATTAATTTEATTSETTEATTTTTTEETTTEATTTTEEETTTTEEETTTTEPAKTRQTTSNTVEGSSINDFSTKITNFAPTEDGFKFDIELKNKSNCTANLPKSLYGLDINLFCDQSITEVTSDGMTFSGDGTSFRGTPNEIAVAGGETYIFTVYVTTSSYVTQYGYNYAYFDWVK